MPRVMQRGGSGGNCRGGIVNTIQAIRDLEGENARACLATTNFLRHLVQTSTANPALSFTPSLSVFRPFPLVLPTGMGKGRIRGVLAVVVGWETDALFGWSRVRVR